jgi:hypothetical protein
MSCHSYYLFIEVPLVVGISILDSVVGISILESLGDLSKLIGYQKVPLAVVTLPWLNSILNAMVSVRPSLLMSLRNKCLFLQKLSSSKRLF